MQFIKTEEIYKPHMQAEESETQANVGREVIIDNFRVHIHMVLFGAVSV